MCGLLLIFLLVDAEVRVAEIELQGAEETVILCKAKRDKLQAGVRSGMVSAARLTELQRRTFDAELWREDCRRTLSIAKGAKEPRVTPARLETLRAIEQLEVARWTSLRTLHEAGAVPSMKVDRAALRYQLAWIDRNFADRLAKKDADVRALEKRRNQDRAKVRLKTAEKLVAYYEQANPGSDELFGAKVDRIRAVTASKVANLPLSSGPVRR